MNLKNALIVSLCKEKLSELEFVLPLYNLFSKKYNVNIVDYKSIKNHNFKKYSLIILSGTALKDFDYLNFKDSFFQLKNFNNNIIGICAGAQILAYLFNIKLIKLNKPLIGNFDIYLFNEHKGLSLKKLEKAYFLTNYVFEFDKENILHKMNEYAVSIKLNNKNNNIYLFSFHPEVLNKDLLMI